MALGLKIPVIMPETKVQKFHLVKVPSHLSQTEALDFIESSFAHCLKKQRDHLVLDLSQVDEFERGYTNLLTKWIRNLKSLNGSLVLIGVDENKHSMLKATRLSSLFDSYNTLEDFKKEKEDVSIIPHDSETTTPSKDRERQSEFENEIPEPEVEIREEKIKESVEDIPPSPGGFSEIEVQGNNPSAHSEGENEPVEEDNIETPSRPNSITEKIDIKKLEELNSDTDVSDKLEFLNSPDNAAVEESIEDAPIKMDSEDVVEITPPSQNPDDGETKNMPDESENLSEEDPLEVSEERSTESFYNIMGESANTDIDVAANMLDELDDVAIDEELFSEEDLEVKPDSGTVEKEPEDSGAAKEIETKEIENATEDPAADDGEEFLDVPIGENSQIIDFSGEYQCLGCGELDYFLKGERFHACKNSNCEGTEDGWHLVCLIF